MLPGLSQGTAKCSPHTCERWTPPASPSSPPHPYLLPTATPKTVLQSAPATTISQGQWGRSTRPQELMANIQKFGEKGGQVASGLK